VTFVVTGAVAPKCCSDYGRDECEEEEKRHPAVTIFPEGVRAGLEGRSNGRKGLAWLCDAQLGGAEMNAHAGTVEGAKGD